MSAGIAAAVGLLTGVLSGCGVGGGSLLMLYLTLCAGFGQYQAAGVNLAYFLACAPAALMGHAKRGLIEGRAVRWCVLAGLPASVLAALLAAHMDTGWLRRAFGLFLLCIGAKELLAGRKHVR
nr:sulfite exporter TauE/SafE family protein [uncultured Agathobaculum sp.]